MGSVMAGKMRLRGTSQQGRDRPDPSSDSSATADSDLVPPDAGASFFHVVQLPACPDQPDQLIRVNYADRPLGFA